MDTLWKCYLSQKDDRCRCITFIQSFTTTSTNIHLPLGSMPGLLTILGSIDGGGPLLSIPLWSIPPLCGGPLSIPLPGPARGSIPGRGPRESIAEGGPLGSIPAEWPYLSCEEVGAGPWLKINKRWFKKLINRHAELLQTDWNGKHQLTFSDIEYD